MKTLLEEIEQRWADQFVVLATGADLAPSSRLRTEGLMEAAVLVGGASIDQLLDSMEAAYQSAFDSSIGDDFGDDWRELFPFPQIPAMMRRAPVVPSTKE